MELRIVDKDSADFLMLADKLDEYYFEIVGPVQALYAEVNKPYNMNGLCVVYEDGEPVGCGAWKQIDETTAEIKRIYVLPQHRRKGVASMIVKGMEADALKAGFRHYILETARTTMDSANLYFSLGYKEIDYYGSPAGAENCRCFEKNI